MARGKGIVYACGSNVFDALLATGTRHGVTLANPSTGRITLLSSEEGAEGDQVPIDREPLAQLVGRLREGEDVTFQLWLNSDTDVVTWVRSLPHGVVAYYFSFDGLLPDEVQSVERTIAELMVEPDIEPVGVVIERLENGVDWDALMLERIRDRVRSHPDLFLAP